MDLKNISNQKKSLEGMMVLGGFITGISFVSFIANPIFMIGFIAGGIIMAVAGSRFKKLSTAFKEVHVKKMIEDEISGILYEPKKGFEKEVVYNSKILRKEDRYYSEDFLSGVIKGKKFLSADVKLQDVRSNGKSTTVVTVFQGRFYIIEFDKKFENDVYIMPNLSIGFNWFSELQRVDLESITFNKLYDVFSIDKHSAFYLLKPAFMEKLIEFRNVAKRVMFGFKDQQVYIALDTRIDAFDLKMFREIDQTFFEEIKREIKLIEELIDLIPA